MAPPEIIGWDDDRNVIRCPARNSRNQRCESYAGHLGPHVTWMSNEAGDTAEGDKTTGARAPVTAGGMGAAQRGPDEAKTQKPQTRTPGGSEPVGLPKRGGC